MSLACSDTQFLSSSDLSQHDIPMLLQIRYPPFSRLNVLPLLSIQPLVAHWYFYVLGTIHMLLLQECIPLLDNLFSFPFIIRTEIELQDRMAVLFLIIWGKSILASIVTEAISIPKKGFCYILYAPHSRQYLSSWW